LIKYFRKHGHKRLFKLRLLSHTLNMLGSSKQFEVRRGKSADAKALVGVFRDSWRHTYQGIIPHTQLDQMILRRTADWWRMASRSNDNLLVLDVGSKLVGYATSGPSRSRGQPQGEIYELYLTPDYQGLGFGEHLFEACRNGLDNKRLNGLLVWALADNDAAIAFYWRRGGRPVAKRADRVGNAKLEKIAFTWG
jgi:ribosomal protein S18 acetylase RimI-like enzyme